MKRLAAVLVLFLWSGLCVAGWLPLAYAPAQQAAFFAAAGSDSNPCSQASPCQTIARANAIHYLAGATVSFNGGDSFTGGLVLNGPGPITVTSYGAGNPTISSGNSAACVSATNIPSVTVSSIICTGGGTLTNTTNGVVFTNSQAGNTKLAGPTISGVTVSGYGLQCILVQGTNGSSGFSGINITNPTTHDCTGNDISTGGGACIEVQAFVETGSGIATPAHLNVTINGFTIFNCNGKTGTSNWSGSGLLVSQTKGIFVGSSSASSVVHDFGANNTNSAGPVGAWVYDSDCNGGGISYVEAYNGKSQGGDGDGFDIDGNSINCHFHHLKAHDNVGYGFQAYNYAGATAWGNNIYSDIVGQNNGTEFGIGFAANATGTLTVQRATLSNQKSGNIIAQLSSGTITCLFANNIFLGSPSIGTMISLPHPSSCNFKGNNYWNYANASTGSGTTATISWNGTSYTGTGATGMATAFAAWQTATGQEKLSGSNVGQTIDPKIYVPGGLFITGGYAPTQDMANNLQSGSPMIGTGVLPSAVGITLDATDYYGATVASNSQTIGAAEGDFASFASSCASATNFIARASVLTKFQSVVYNSTMCGFNSDGNLANLDALYLFGPAAPDETTAQLNLVSSSFNLTKHGTCTFAAGQGYTCDGSTGYFDTGITPSAGGLNYVQNSASFGSYGLNNRTASSNTSTIGAECTASACYMGMFPNDGGLFAEVNATASSMFTAISTSQGLSAAARSSSAASAMYKNGVNQNATPDTSVGVPSSSIFLFAFSTFGSPSLFSSDQLSAAFIGANTNAANVSLRLNSAMTAGGINVY